MNKRLKSRKFWMSVLGAVIGVASAVVGIGGKIGAVAGIIVAVGSCIVYTVTEGKIDMASVKITAETVLNAIDEIKAGGSE